MKDNFEQQRNLKTQDEHDTKPDTESPIPAPVDERERDEKEVLIAEEGQYVHWGDQPITPILQSKD
ncbi:hypothetical protein KFU94_26780 [Chloroflexi bacterium TSY]|nr:hypothetical protein [Chloroflexi bacterium TSY]